MTIRNLDALFKPRSVTVIGASNRDGSIGRLVMQNLLTGGFDGAVMPVNPNRKDVLGVRAYPDVASLPHVPDLAVIAVPARAVPGIVAALAARGTRGVVVISAGCGELTDGGITLQQAMLDAARPRILRIVGPNSLGVVVPRAGLNASFAHLTPVEGSLAFVAQSGAVMTSVLDWAQARGIGFSHLVSLGDMADVDFGDMLDYLARDAATSAILLYLEAVTHARKFMSAGRAAARVKPVVVVKAGRHEQSGRAAATHTGRLAGPDAEYDAAFRRAGMLRVATLEELFDAVETLARARTPRGGRLLILSNGGGPAVLAADALLDGGGELAPPAPATLSALDAALPRGWSRGNPVDIVGDAPAQRYAAALRIALRDPNADGVLVLHCPTAVASGRDAARAVIEVLKESPPATVLASWLGEHTASASREELERHRVPSYPTPEQAVRAFLQMVDYRRNQELLMQTPPSQPEQFVADAVRARAVVDGALSERRQWLTAAESRAVLAAYGLPVNEVREVRSPQAAAEAAAELGGPVALKIAADGVVHKSDVGGVALDLRGPAAVKLEAEAMLLRVRAARPDTGVRGFTVERMVDRSRGVELIAGATSGGDFGPMILFGRGGTAVEIFADTAVELPPLNLRLANDLIARTRVVRELRGYRDVPPADLDAVALALTRVSQLVVDIPELAEVDLNPLLATADGVLALDARIRVAAAQAGERADARLAIRPYPKELEQEVRTPDGRVLLIRPILPEDEPALAAAFSRLTPDEIRARFLGSLKTMPHPMAARLTQIDYDREMALVLTEHGVPGRTELYGVVRLVADPDNSAAEFAVIVAKPFTGRGFGRLLMRRIIDYARSRGIRELFGDVLADNAPMRGLCRSLKFAESGMPDAPGLVRVTLAL
ncbi:MAG TPA: bifunctional acetate--CoA ligase family protein/GNAT family N-acetyltransferase [Gammaproteobacteria bacterium]|nr:bifunctional acetate--CoA ligase family protein/GNAT family N-acetyltransferase [Gammaproteobacteria bacterium]